VSWSEKCGLIFEYASVIKNKNSLNAHLRTLHRFADIEMVVVILSDLEGIYLSRGCLAVVTAVSKPKL